jgi:acetamidase/formamidase
VDGVEAAASARNARRPDYFVSAQPQNVVWGGFPIMMGIDHDLDRAMRLATREVVKFLVEEKGLTPAKAFSLASIAVDFHAAEVVDGTQLIVGKISKDLFLEE